MGLTIGNNFGVGQRFQSGLIKPIPNKLDALFWLDGVVTDENGTKYFRDRTSNNRKFLITNYDFDSTWIAGMPYKSTATISAPSEDATLIASDVNNFLYASNGTPNQIPVVSLFQDVDYAHKLFCRHFNRVTDTNGVELKEPRVLDIVLYNTVKVGGELTNCQDYFGVPTENVSAKWIATNGNDSTGNGTKSNPYLTFAKVQATISSGGAVYIKSGLYVENISGLNIFLNKSATYIATGFTTVRGAAAAGRAVYLYGSNTIHFEGFIIDGENIRDTGIEQSGGVKTSKRCFIKNITTIDFNGDCTENNFIDCITTKCGCKFSSVGVNISGCLNIVDGAFYAYLCDVGTGTTNILYNKVKPTSTTQSTVLSFKSSATFNVKFNSFDHSNLTNKRLLYYSTGYTQTVNFEYNNVFSSNVCTAPMIDCDTQNCISTTTIKNNRFEFTNTGSFGTASTISLLGQIGVVISNNVFIHNTENYLAAIRVVTTTKDIGTATISNNYIKSKANTGHIIIVGTETTAASDNLIKAVIEGNHIDGYYTFGGSTPGNTHSIFVGHNINPIIRYNYLNGCQIGIVLKHTGGVYSTDNVSYNILKNTQRSLLVKGVNGLKFYNNTIKSEIASSIGISTENHSVGASNLTLKNNIVDVIGNPMNILSGTETGFVSDYNTLYGTSGSLWLGSEKTFAQWQSLGFDAHGSNVNPNLANLIPENKINGVDLGAGFKDGLNTLSNYATGSIPNVLTTQQGEQWQIGAFIK